ncbi:MAG: LysM peptidoglycan-binding domain-containing protein [Alphaproteobacteria bacterium]|nr:LysM peptidoglycan-binding domain-containing protein [Alphaproteobacteria bacterium]
MRGLSFPASFLVLACLVCGWGASLLFSSGNQPEWQTAGLGRQVESERAIAPWTWSTWADGVGVSSPAAAQDRDGEAEGGSLEDFAPTFSRIAIRPGRSANFEGLGEPGGRIELKLDGKSLGSVPIGVDGTWKLSTLPLGAGDHRIVVEARKGLSSKAIIGQEVRVAIPNNVSGSEIVAYEAPDAAEAKARVRSRAERLADAASREFDNFTQREERDAAVKRAERERAQARRKREEQELAQREADRQTADERVDRARDGNRDQLPGVGQLGEWYSRSAKDYHEFVVPELAKKGGRQGAGSELANVPPPERPGDPSAIDILPSLDSIVQRTSEWLRSANRTYQEKIVRDLSTGPEDQPSEAPRDDLETAERAPVGDEGSDRDEAESRRQAALDEQEAARRREADERQRERREQARRERERLEKEREERERLAAAAKKAEEDRLKRVAEAQAVAERQAREKRERESEAARLAREEEEAAEKRRLDELLEERNRQKRLADEAEEAERQRLLAEEEQKERARILAQQQAREEERKRESELRQRQLDEFLEQQAAEKRRLADDAAKQERDRLAKLEAERLEQARLRQERFRQRGLDRERERQLAAKYERALQVARLSDDAGFGRDGREKSSRARRNLVVPALPERLDDDDARRSRIGLSRRDVGSARSPSRRIIREKSRRADVVARLFDAAYRERLREIRRDHDERHRDIPLPAEPEVRRSALRLANRLGGPPRARGERRGVRSAGWRARGFRPARGRGCRDERAGQTISVPGTYVVARGDTLWHISRRHYGRGVLYGLIYGANRKRIRHPHWIYPCQKFRLPRR